MTSQDMEGFRNMTPSLLKDTLCILAIDPGLTGAMAFYHPEAIDRVSVYDMPVVGGEINAAELSRMIKRYKPTLAVIERVGPMPRDGVMQAWRFSGAYHTARTVVALLGIPTSLVTPTVWKKGMSVKGGPDGKEQCRAMANRMFPFSSEYFARKKDQGRAEAALLAYYVSQKFIAHKKFHGIA